MTESTGRLTPAANFVMKSSMDSIKTVEDAIEELVRNSCGSYLDRSNKIPLGDIIILYNYAKGDNAYFSVTDHGCGMSHMELKKAFTTIGESTAKSDDVNIFGRGAKDCARIGEMIVSTFQDGKFSKCKINRKTDWKLSGPFKATQELRKEHGIKENGTSVIVKRRKESNVKFPLLKNLHKILLYKPGLQPYISEDAVKKGSNICIKGTSKTDKKIKLERKSPETTIVFDEEFLVEGTSKARFILKKSEKKIPDDKILVKSTEYGCHDESFLKVEFTDNPNLEYYCGEISCNELHAINLRIRSEDADEEYTIDRFRRSGLNKNNAFAKKLHGKCCELLDEEIQKINEEQKDSSESKEEKKLLSDLAKIGSDLLNEDIDPDDLDTDGLIDKARVYEWMIWPPINTLLVNTKKKFTIYCSERRLNTKSNVILTPNFNSLSKFIKIDKQIKLEQQPDKNSDMYKGSFTIEALDKEVEGEISFLDVKKESGIFKIIIKESLIYDFKNDLEFGSTKYSVTLDESKPRTIKLYARYPEFISAEAQPKISINNQNIKFKGSPQPIFKVKDKSNYALAEFKVTGRHLNEASTITASINGSTTECLVRTVEKEDSGNSLIIEGTDKKFGDDRFYWQVPGQHLLFTRNHPLTKDILSTDKTDTPEYRILLCEILADAFTVARCNVLTDKTSENYQYWTDLGTPREIFSSVYANMRIVKNKILIKIKKFRL